MQTAKLIGQIAQLAEEVNQQGQVEVRFSVDSRWVDVHVNCPSAVHSSKTHWCNIFHGDANRTASLVATHKLLQQLKEKYEKIKNPNNYKRHDDSGK